MYLCVETITDVKLHLRAIFIFRSENQSQVTEVFTSKSVAEEELSEEEPNCVQHSIPSTREPDWSSTSSSENEAEPVSMETSEPSAAAHGTSNTNKSGSEDEDEDNLTEPKRSQRRFKDRKAKRLNPESNQTSNGISLKYPNRTAKRFKTGLENIDKEIRVEIDGHTVNESSEESEESELEKENTCANVKIGIRETRQETKNILNSSEDSEQDSQESSSEHDAEDTAKNTPSCVLREREVHRAVVDRESTGKRHEKDFSLRIEESSESDDSEIEAVAVNVKGEKKTVPSKVGSGKKGGTRKSNVNVAAMEAGEESSSDTDTESDSESENIRKNLFKRYISKNKSGKQQVRSLMSNVR